MGVELKSKAFGLLYHPLPRGFYFLPFRLLKGYLVMLLLQCLSTTRSICHFILQVKNREHSASPPPGFIFSVSHQTAIECCSHMALETH